MFLPLNNGLLWCLDDTELEQYSSVETQGSQKRPFFVSSWTLWSFPLCVDVEETPQ